MAKPSEPNEVWYVYLIRAVNQSLYCGISRDPYKRFIMHASGRGARFFRSSPAQALVYIEACENKSAALRRECFIKTLSKAAKEQLSMRWLRQRVDDETSTVDSSLS